jgi:AraC family transcriptional regulator of adaptative response / DNA-3-methyladenine glycosylase II
MDTATEVDFKKIIARRDRRFDGRFYFGVTTTRIYCRPVCPAKPKPENIRLFKSVAEAENSGYRPCLRCRPDRAPGTKGLDGTINTVSRALRLINDAVDDVELPVEKLARSLGMSDRHVRRLFDQHLGASPIEIMITQRLHFAKQMVHETAKPMTEIAFAAGFQSVRRFNEAFAHRFRQSPSALRRRQGATTSNALILKVPLRPPYDWPTVLAYLAKHAAAGIETVANGEYRRFVPLEKSFGTIVVSKPPTRDVLDVQFIDIPLIDVRALLARVKNLFDTDHNPVHLPARSALRPNGIRVPGSFDPFETAVSIVLGQIVSIAHAKANLQTLIQRFGRKIGVCGADDVYEFPSPSALATARVEKIGLTKTKGDAIRALARAVRDGALDFKSPADFSVTRERLLGLRGIGAWTATMIAMRCLGDPDAFPENDLIVRRALDQALVDHREWSSSRAYLTHCLWRDHGAVLSKKSAPNKAGRAA